MMWTAVALACALFRKNFLFTTGFPITDDRSPDLSSINISFNDKNKAARMQLHTGSGLSR